MGTVVRVERFAADGWPEDASYLVHVPAGVRLADAFPGSQSQMALPLLQNPHSLNGHEMYLDCLRAAEARTRALSQESTQRTVKSATSAALPLALPAQRQQKQHIVDSPEPPALAAARLTIPHGVCAGTFDAVFISTDLEPDDLIAIKLLAPKLRGLPLLVVVGEGSLPDKRPSCARLLAAYGIDAQATIVQGRASEAAYPADLFDGYPMSTGQGKLEALNPTPRHVGSTVDTFLKQHANPFALLLKPPHELLDVSREGLQRTTCAIYGSFNLVEFRSATAERLRAARSRVFSDPQVASDLAWTQQEDLLHSFKACLLIERSSSVGRDAILHGGQGSIWPFLDDDRGLVHAIRAWNRISVTSMSEKISDLGREVSRVFRASMLGDNSGDPSGSFAAMADVVAGADKKISIIKAIVEHDGLQSPLADPLVIAALLDTTGSLAAHEVRCRLGHSAGKLTHREEAASRLAILISKGPQEQTALRAATEAAIARLAQACARQAKP